MEFIDNAGPEIKTSLVEDERDGSLFVACHSDCKGMFCGYPKFCLLGFARTIGQKYPIKGMMIPGERCPGIKHPGRAVQYKIVEIEIAE